MLVNRYRLTPTTRTLWTLLAIASALLLSRAMQPYFDETNIIMVYMLAVVVVATTLGLWPAIMACLLSVPVFDYANVPPYFEFTRREWEHLFTFGVMMVTAATIGTLAGRLRHQARAAQERAARTESLLALSEELAGNLSADAIIIATGRHMSRAAHLGDGPDGQPHLRAMARLAGQAHERLALRDQVRESEIRARQETLRSSILGAVSHDLRTPLASIIGASSSLVEAGSTHSDDARARLLGVVYHEAVQMHRMVENLLDLARLRSGDAGGERSWQAIEEIVGSSLEAVRRRPVDRVFAVDVPADLPLLRCDGVLIERVLVNLLENAIKYSPAGSRIALQAGVDDREIVIAVSDQGPGVPADLRDKVFEPFFRAGDNAGSGLGLTICRGIVEAHGGSVQLGTAAGGGARVVVRLPLPAEPPELASEPEPGERHG